MFTTKKQVDQHVKTSLAKLRSENEVRRPFLPLISPLYCEPVRFLTLG